MNEANRQIMSILGEAVEHRSPEERAAFLDEACAGDADRRARVEALLRAYQAAGNFMQGKPSAPEVALRADAPIAERPGSVIGPYKLLEPIGEGGFGVVFMAEQTQPVRRKVALKILKPGMDTRQVVARFEAERQALAIMDHPNIAKVFDGGSTSEPDAPARDGRDPFARAAGSGRPYFVMELVKGGPITEFCDQNHLPIRERLELFLTVCHAVQHAHQKGIIHRDLKPSNVLVASHDGTPVVKVIDFGIAKAMSGALTDKTLFTGFAQMIGTPLYMSPEQAGQSSLDVDTRSDIYSLGVMLYELLTGTTPFDKEQLSKLSYDQLRHIIREDEPPKPSTRISTLGQLATTASTNRKSDPRRLSQLVRGELDWIVMKALEKDRNRRYESASVFAADIERYLHDEPVQACPPSAGYRFRKFTRRHRRLLVTAGMFAAVLVLATAVSIWQAVKARDAQRQAEADNDRATTEAAIARAVKDFLQTDLLGQVNSEPQPGQDSRGNPNLTVREALHRAAARIGQRFQDQPLVEAAIRTTIGAAFNSLDESKFALPHLERAAALRQAHLGADHPDTLAGMHHLAEACRWVGRFPEAITLHQQILENRMASLGPDNPETLAQTFHLAVTYRAAGQWRTSMPLLEQLLEKQRIICGPTHPDTLGTMHALAMNYISVNQFADSIALHKKVLELKPANRPEFFLRTFATACQGAGRLDQADRLLREALAQTRKRGDSQGRLSTASTLLRLVQNLLLQQRYAAAEPIVHEALAIFENERPDDLRYFKCLSLLGGMLLGQERYAEAEPLLLRGYEGMKSRAFGDWQRGLAEAGQRVVRFYEATQQQEKALSWREKLAAEKSPTD